MEGTALVVYDPEDGNYHSPVLHAIGLYELRGSRFNVACGAELGEHWTSAYAQLPDGKIGSAVACPLCFPRWPPAPKAAETPTADSR